jgi:7-cyano-7-deazaguanine tRNA-ribosyltransferase
MEPDFEIRDRDLAGRIGRLKTGHGTIETPTILPVINPNKLVIAPKELPKYGAEGLITNSYILWKDYQQEAIDQGVHNFLDFDRPIMTDSGAFQLMQYGDIDVSNKDIIKFQEKIGVDIGVILDVPVSSQEKKDMARGVSETIKRAKEAQKYIKGSDVLWAGPVQGGVHLDLLKKSAKEMAKLDFAVHPIGSVVPLLVKYRFAEHVEIIRAAKELLPSNRPVHLFGAGHPMFFSFAVALGIDLFDSAAYSLYAQEDRYITQSGTEHLDELDYFPCSCPICSKHTPESMRESPSKTKLLAEHNLYVTFEEIRTIKQAIKEKTLWELLELRARSHPSLIECMNHLVKNTDYISKQDPLTKKHFFYLSDFSKQRPEVERVRERIKSIKGKKTEMKPFGKIPEAIFECYPFSQTILPEKMQMPKTKNSIEKLKAVSQYWFGVNIFKDNMKIDVSRRTHKIRAVYDDNRLFASVRAQDFMILLHEGAKVLYKKTKRFRVQLVADKDVEKYAREGRSVFAKFVKKADPNIIPGQEVLVVNSKGKLLATGEALLTAKEMKEFKRGAAVKLRWTNK